jgi:hypothetical protein
VLAATEISMNTTIQAATADVRASFEAKVRGGIFQPVARHLREDLVDDRLAEGVGMAFEQSVTRAAGGHIMPDALLVQACHLRAVDLGRRLAGAGGGQPKRDVMDERNYKEDRVEVLHLDGELGDDEDEGFVLALADVDVEYPARWLHSALDLESWLSCLAAGDRLLLALRRGGHTLEEIAKATGKSITTVLKRLRELGRELAARVDDVTWLEAVL